MFKTAKKKDFVRLIQAAREGDIAEVKEVVLKHKIDYVDRRDDQEWSALFWAVFNGHFEVVKYLVEVMSADVKQVDDQGRSVLYLSCGWGGEAGDSGELTKYLIEHGADVNTITTDGWSPLYLTAFRGKTFAAEHLLEAGADLLQSDSKGRSPLAIAKATKHSQMIPILTKAAAARMFEATREGKSSVLQTLIEEYSLDVNQKDEQQQTPLHVAMEYGNEGVVKILISCGADDQETNGDGLTPIALAESLGKRAAISALQAAIESREQHRKSRIILEKERLMLLNQRKLSREAGLTADDGDGAAEASSGQEKSEESDATSAPGVGILNFEITSYAVKILAKMPAGVAWRDIDQMMEDLDIVDDILVEEPDLSDLLNWSVWETDPKTLPNGGESSAAEKDPAKETAVPGVVQRASSGTSTDGVEVAAKPKRSHSSRRRPKRLASAHDSAEETDDEYDESGDEEEPAW